MTGPRYAFKNAPAGDWKRFCDDAGAWKPNGYDREMQLRLAYYLNQQLDDTKAELARRFPETHKTMTPITLPVVRHFVREQAKVFLSTTKLELVQDGKPLAGEKAKDGTERPHPTAAWWERVKEQMGLGLRLKRADAYTTLFKTAALCFSWSPTRNRIEARIAFPHSIRAVMDPAAPMDIDQAHLVAMEIASEAGLKADGARRWECWCAREGEEHHFILRERGEGAVEIEWEDDGGPLLTLDERAIVPLVFFTAHTEELGLFTAEESDLVPVNRAMNILVTDIHHIAEQQGFGVMVITSPAGANAPAKIIRAPNTAISLEGGVEADFIDPNAPLADLLALADQRIRQDAVLRGMPAGSVSVEARAVSSGIALQIENRPILELRSDAIETYRDPMRRMWNVIRALWDAYSDRAADQEVGDLSEIDLRWTPGDVQVPVDDAQKVDDVLAKLKARLSTRAEAIAELRGITVEEARTIAAAIDEEDGAGAGADENLEDDPLGLKAKRDELAGAPGTKPVPGSAPAAADAGVVQDTALNGAQVTALLDIVQAAADKELPLDSVQALLEAAFPALTPALISRILSGLKKFKPAPAAPVPAPFLKAQRPPPPPSPPPPKNPEKPVEPPPA